MAYLGAVKRPVSTGEARGTGGLKLAEDQSLRFHSSMAGSPEEVLVKE